MASRINEMGFGNLLFINPTEAEGRLNRKSQIYSASHQSLG